MFRHTLVGGRLATQALPCLHGVEGCAGLGWRRSRSGCASGWCQAVQRLQQLLFGEGLGQMQVAADVQAGLHIAGKGMRGQRHHGQRRQPRLPLVSAPLARQANVGVGWRCRFCSQPKHGQADHGGRQEKLGAHGNFSQRRLCSLARSPGWLQRTPSLKAIIARSLLGSTGLMSRW